jgi:hypothetical protein
VLLDHILLIEPVQRSVLVGQDQRVVIFRKLGPANFFAIACLYVDVPWSKPAHRGDEGGTWIHDYQVQALRRSCSRGRKIGCDNPTSAVHLMTAAAAAPTLEGLFARRNIARHYFVRRRAIAAQAPKIRNDAPDIIGGQAGKGGHLSTGNVRSDIVEKVVIFVAMPEASCGQRGTSIATRLSSVTGLACLRYRRLPAAIAAGSFANGLFDSSCCARTVATLRQATTIPTLT